MRRNNQKSSEKSYRKSLTKKQGERRKNGSPLIKDNRREKGGVRDREGEVTIIDG